MNKINPEHKAILDNAWTEFYEDQLDKDIEVVPYDIESAKLLFQVGFTGGVIWVKDEYGLEEE